MLTSFINEVFGVMTPMTASTFSMLVQTTCVLGICNNYGGSQNKVFDNNDVIGSKLI